MTKVIDSVEAKRLQGEIMQRMRRYGGKNKLSWSAANQKAADEVAKANGFASTQEMRAEIGRHNKPRAANGAKPNKRKEEKAILVAARIVREYLDNQAGELPPDWKLAAELGISPYEAGAGRRMLAKLGWSVKAKTNGYLATPPAPAVAHEPAPNGSGNGAQIQATFELSTNDEEQMIKEVRQIRGLLAKLVTVLTKEKIDDNS